MTRVFNFLRRNEHQISTLVFVGGFALDVVSFTLLDISVVNLLFLGYVIGAAFFILIAFIFGPYRDAHVAWKRWPSVVAPLAANFLISGVLSGSVIFYTKSAVVFVSWPFLLLLAVIFLGNEFFRSYRSHFIFQTTLVFFALYAYTIFALPLYVNQLGPRVFLESTAIAAGAFALYIGLIALFDWQRLKSMVAPIMGGALLVMVALVSCYFSGLIPPLPLTVKESGVYQNIIHTEQGYVVQYEGSSHWSRYLPRTVHHVAGTPLYAYSAIFAPAAFSANIVHRWEWYDPAQKKWITKSMVAFPLAGGREGGYRGYSEVETPVPGRWRVSFETTEGQTVGRLSFTVQDVSAAPTLYTATR